jgi:hypothetical protein
MYNIFRLKGECDNYMDVCCNAPLKEPIAPPPRPHVNCGMRNPEGVGFRITGNDDNEAQYGEIPWMVRKKIFIIYFKLPEIENKN